MNFMRLLSTAATFCFVVVTVFAYQNCGQFMLNPNALGLSSLGATGVGGADLVPTTDKVDASCATNASYDACVFKQNPVASANGQALSANAATRATELRVRATYGVKLTSLSNSGKLENGTVTVRSNKPELTIMTQASTLKAAPGTTGSSAFEQVNAYYWATRTAEYFHLRTKALPAIGKAVNIVVDDSITGYDPANNTIRLKSTSANGSIAWSGDLVVHLFGLANLHLANPSGWASLSAAKHLTCNAVDDGCCASQVGCANAIRFGVGEYFAASMFPSRTRIGEALANNGSPQTVGGLSRDVASVNSTAAQAYSSSGGNISAMGLVYASIWWQVRAAAGKEVDEIDRIFLEHLSLLNGEDDFATAIAKAKTVDARLFSGKHAGKFNSQLSARGL